MDVFVGKIDRKCNPKYNNNDDDRPRNTHSFTESVNTLFNFINSWIREMKTGTSLELKFFYT